MKRVFGLLALLLLTGVTASGQAFDANGGKWEPTRLGECSKAIHDTYFMVVDGVKYHAFHPPTDPSGCPFGHEHGQDVGFPFGVVDNLSLLGNMPRLEDHVGYKGTNLPPSIFTPQGNVLPVAPITCWGAILIHQGTHSPDAFQNNLHEVRQRMECDNGLAFEVMFFAAIGRAGTMMQECSPQVRIATNPPVPANSPVTALPGAPGGSMGDRFISTQNCIERSRPDYGEIWKGQNITLGPTGTVMVRPVTYWFVGNPSRFRKADGTLGRTIDQCYRVVGGLFQTISNPCLNLRRDMAGVPVSWDDPRSPWDGASRNIKFNDFSVNAPDSGITWYTSTDGRRASMAYSDDTPLRQWARGSHPQAKAWLGPTIGTNTGDLHTHAPN